MTLGERQRLFSRLLPKLLDHIHGLGFEVTLAEGYIGDSINKPTEDTPHLRTGGHFKRLAQDLNVFDSAGKLLTHTEDHRSFGEFWESLHPSCRWGGRFAKADGNHYSIEEGGIA
jgi:hypothetical protein